jgi:Spy/CpxP family protein refolding chaperone
LTKLCAAFAKRRHIRPLAARSLEPQPARSGGKETTMQRSHVLGSLAGVGAVLILGGVALAAATLSADGSTSSPGPSPDAPVGMLVPGAMPPALLGRLADELGLTPEQRQTIRGLFDQARPGFGQLRRQMQAGAELLVRTAPDDPAYQSVVANVSQSAADLAAQFVLQAGQLRSQVHGVLTAEQRAQLAALEPGLYARWQERRHADHPGGRPPEHDPGALAPQ